MVSALGNGEEMAAQLCKTAEVVWLLPGQNEICAHE